MRDESVPNTGPRLITDPELLFVQESIIHNVAQMNNILLTLSLHPLSPLQPDSPTVAMMGKGTTANVG